ncbi:MAG: cobalamin biosynthesis protein [Candidatus Bathyarchaeota archaeon]|nr:cobalamin biosynthesis protein [Candidatus Bathyarchaeota archaeon]
MVLFDTAFFVEQILILAVALLIDVIFGEIPDSIHPTVWMGKVIAWAKPQLKSTNSRIEKINGVLLCLGVVALFTLPIGLLLLSLRQVPIFGWLIYIIVAAVFLKSTFAVKCMLKYTMPIANALKMKDLEGAKQWLPYIVRRDPKKLDEQHVLSATVESIAESTTDGVTSPLLFFALFGVPGAFAFRVVNTLDSMVGYKDEEHRNIGWFSAKMDTAANFISARFTAVLMIISAAVLGANWKKGLSVLQRDKNKTVSPNAGWTISAMAGALNVQLEKEGHYTLGDKGQLSPNHIIEAWRIMVLTSALFGVIVVASVLALRAVVWF